MSSAYANSSATNSAKLLHFFAMTDIHTTDVDPEVKEGSFAAIARSYAIADREIILPTPVNQFYLPPSGSYNAELVKQLSPEMQVKIQNYGTPIDK